MCHSECLIPCFCHCISFWLWISAFCWRWRVWMDVTAECWGGWCSPETWWQVWSGLFLSFSFGSHRCHNAPPGVWKLPEEGAMEVTPFMSVSQRWRWQTTFTLLTVTGGSFLVIILISITMVEGWVLSSPSLVKISQQVIYSDKEWILFLFFYLVFGKLTRTEASKRTRLACLSGSLASFLHRQVAW